MEMIWTFLEANMVFKTKVENSFDLVENTRTYHQYGKNKEHYQVVFVFNPDQILATVVAE